MNWSHTPYCCPNENHDTPLDKREHECYLLQDFQKLFDGSLVANWIKCNTCGYEYQQISLNLPKSVEVIRHG